MIVRHPNSKKLFFENDPYDIKISIKESERDRCSNEISKNIFIKAKNKFSSPKEFAVFFINSSNKIRLQNFLKEEFIKYEQRYGNIDFMWIFSGN